MRENLPTHMSTTTLASNYAQGRAAVAVEQVYVPFTVRTHRLWPYAKAEYVTPRTARNIGAKNIRPDGAGLYLIADWPKHLTS